jgi:hypothetical protein
MAYRRFMLVVLMKGKTKRVVASPKATGWIAPDHEDFPHTTQLKTESAFIAHWKKLQKQGYKDTAYITARPKSRPRKQAYVVKAAGPMDPLFKAFAGWLKAQAYGAVGYFEVQTGKLPKRISSDSELIKSGRSLLHLPEGSVIAANATGQILLLDSDGGEPKRLADGVRPFLAKLAKGRTGASDLDDKDATGRKALAAWLASR